VLSWTPPPVIFGEAHLRRILAAYGHLLRAHLTFAKERNPIRNLVGAIRSRAMGLLLIAIGICNAFYLVIWLARVDSPRFGDFFGLWTFAAPLRVVA
jgi:hypothetical protein